MRFKILDFCAQNHDTGVEIQLTEEMDDNTILSVLCERVGASADDLEIDAMSSFDTSFVLLDRTGFTVGELKPVKG